MSTGEARDRSAAANAEMGAVMVVGMEPGEERVGVRYDQNVQGH